MTLKLNRKIVILTFAVVLALVIGILIIVTTDSKDVGNKDTDSKIEQNKEDIDVNNDDDKWSSTESSDNDNQNSNDGIEVLEPDEVVPGNSSDASGDWEEQGESDTQAGTTDTQEGTTDTETGNSDTETDASDNQNQSGTSNGDNKGNDNQEPDKDKGVLKDNINWGNIY